MPITPERASQTSHIPFPDFKGNKRWLGKAATPFALSLLAACGAPDVRAVGGNLPIPTVAGDSSEVNAQNTAIAGANTTSAANESSATVVAGGKIPPEGTQTPEKIVHCGILPDQFCGSGEPVIRPGRNIVTSIRFKAPPGTPITSLFAAKVTTVLGKEAQEGKKAVEPQTGLIPLDKTIPPLIINGDLTDQLVDTNDKGVSEADQVAKVGPSGEINISWSAYNPANRSSVSDQESLDLFKRFFSEAMQKQPVIVPLASAGGGWSVAEPKFTSGKP